MTSLRSLSTLVALSTLLRACLARTFYGCYTEGTTSRALNATSYIDLQKMTVDACERYCADKRYGLFGLEYGSECYCGNNLETGAISTFSSQCAVPCAGDSKQTCGGGAHLSLWGSSAQKPAEKPVPHPEATKIDYVGCFVDGLNGGQRVLTGAAVADQKEMSVFSCGRFCLNRGFTVFGLEYTSECYCGALATVQGLTRALEADCSMACSGNKDQVCGGSSRIGLFQWK
jgi:hypothetical protein